MENANFVDYVKINCRSGNGGAGSVHLHRDKLTARGGPDGGNGGDGGSIYIKGNSQLWTLLHLKYRKHIIADDGQNGAGNNMSGAAGKDIIIEVPLGTLAKDFDSGEVISEITEEGQIETLLKGGRGGMGNANFKTATRQTPRFAQPGGEGLKEWKILELKILADVGLVGFPNAGKPTLLSVVSAAKPEIADYPFTTLVPNLGIVAYRDYKSFVMADIPGIIKDAHKGKGLGHRFLRHIERNSLLLFMIPADDEDINKTYEILLNELKQYNPELVLKERLLAITKSDLIDDELKSMIIPGLPDIPSVFISSVKEEGLDELKDLIWITLNG